MNELIAIAIGLACVIFISKSIRRNVKMNESMQEVPPVDNEDAFEEDPTMGEVEGGGYPAETSEEDIWQWGDWDAYTKDASRMRLENQQDLLMVGRSIISEASRIARWQYVFQFIASALLFAGGVWAMASAIVFMTNGSFIEQATERLSGLEILDAADVLFAVTLLSPPILLALLGFALISIAVGVSRHPIIQMGMSGISRVQHELAAGAGETRPLVQVVEETINNARQTFTVQLRLSQAMFWIGMLFLVVTLWRAVGMDQPEVLQTMVTVGTGTMGILGWLFSYLISRSKKIQANLADVTQLELGLVGIAKQVNYLDQWLADYPYQYGPERQEMQRATDWALQALQRGTFAASGLVELYAQTPEDEDEQKERSKLLNEALQIHVGLVSDTTGVSGLAAIAGNYATVLEEAANILTIEEVRKAGASPTNRQQLRDKTGIRLEAIVEIVRLADLMRLPSVTSDAARLLRDAEIASMADLAKADPSALHQTLTKINTKQKLLAASPSLGDVTSWVEQAKTLPQEITY